MTNKIKPYEWTTIKIDLPAKVLLPAVCDYSGSSKPYKFIKNTDESHSNAVDLSEDIIIKFNVTENNIKNQ